MYAKSKKDLYRTVGDDKKEVKLVMKADKSYKLIGKNILVGENGLFVIIDENEEMVNNILVSLTRD